jgi:hypothetical protein
MQNALLVISNLAWLDCRPSTARRGGFHSVLSRTFYDEGFSWNVVNLTTKVSAAMWSSHGQLMANSNRRMSDVTANIYDIS